MLIKVFDIRYRICGDSDFLQRLGPNIKTGFIDEYLVNMSVGGISDSTAALKEGYLSRKRNRVLPEWMNLYEYYRLSLIVAMGRIRRLIVRTFFRQQ